MIAIDNKIEQAMVSSFTVLHLCVCVREREREREYYVRPFL